MVSIIEISGKHYSVIPGQRLVIGHLTGQLGQTIEYSDLLSGGTLRAHVLEQRKGAKVVSRKFRNKTRYQRTKGHRQQETVLLFQSAPSLEKKTKAD